MLLCYCVYVILFVCVRVFVRVLFMSVIVTGCVIVDVFVIVCLRVAYDRVCLSLFAFVRQRVYVVVFASICAFHVWNCMCRRAFDFTLRFIKCCTYNVFLQCCTLNDKYAKTKTRNDTHIYTQNYKFLQKKSHAFTRT